MKKHLLTLSILLLSLSAYSQITFEQGYFIDNEDNKTNCLIKNEDWRFNPTKFQYKISENSELITLHIDDVIAFGVDNQSAYVRSLVAIDRSSNDVNSITNDRKPFLETETIFLKTLVQGKANLYSYTDGNLIRFFYNTENTNIQQLVYKIYKKPGNNKILENNRFRNQLWLDLKCPTFKQNKIENLNYKKTDLINFFVAYNKCNDESYSNYEPKQKKDLFNLSFRPGISRSRLLAQSGTIAFDEPYLDYKLTGRFGLEFECIMPFNKNKFAVILEPSYQYYKASGPLTTQFSNQEVDIDYKSFELPIGIRYYIFLNEASKFFIDASIVLNTTANSTLLLNGSGLPLETKFNGAIGLGYKYNDKYSVELRSYTKRKIVKQSINLDSDIQRISVVFGYSIF